MRRPPGGRLMWLTCAVDGADHALSSEESQKAYSSMLAAWISEMVIGARLDRYPHYAPWYA